MDFTKLWPFRSRPVAVPFTDDYTGRVEIIAEDVTGTDFDASIPGNLYCIPTTITLRWECTSGIRNTTASHVFFYRGSIAFGAGQITALSNNFDGVHVLAAIGQNAASISASAIVHVIPWPLLLYPDDRLHFTYPSRLASGDYLHYITVHGKFWEAH